MHILIWDAHTRTGHNIEPYAYGISHTRMGQPIRVWDVPYAYGPIYAYGAEQLQVTKVKIIARMYT